MRYFYSLLLYLSVPLLVLRLFWRSLKDKAYRRRIAERFGFYAISLNECIWIHAVSVGEVIAATPIIQHLRTQYRGKQLLVTTMTPTGSQRVKETFGGEVQHVYLPYDLPDAWLRFMRKMQPQIALIIETELWPNLLAACTKQNIPVCLLNARLSARSLRGYQRITALSREMMQHLKLITAVSAADAKRFQLLGAKEEKIKVTGNIKFDLQLPASCAASELRKRLQGDQRFIWIAASTHEGEEAMMIAAHEIVRAKNPQALLIIVPRHRDRFDEVARLCHARLPTVRHSEFAAGNNLSGNVIADDVAIYLGDSMGELLAFYAAADIAFVGGSLIPHGGHNMIEPAALSKAIVTGPHIFNFAGESELFIAANALIKVQDISALAQQIIVLMQDAKERLAYGERARAIVDVNRGALQRQLEYVTQVMSSREIKIVH